MKKLIILRGYPGSGKTTVGKALEKAGSGIFIDHNQILTFIVQFTENDDGIYEEISQLEQAMTRKVLDDKKSVIVARGFSSSASIQKYIDVTKEQGATPYVIRLEVSMDNLIQRVQSPERKQDFNPTTNEEVLKNWINDNPFEDYPEELVVDANLDVETVVSRIRGFISAE